jgi:hypothetical protein
MKNVITAMGLVHRAPCPTGQGGPVHMGLLAHGETGEIHFPHWRAAARR